MLEPRAGLKPATCRLVEIMFLIGSLGLALRHMLRYSTVFGK